MSDLPRLAFRLADGEPIRRSVERHAEVIGTHLGAVTVDVAYDLPARRAHSVLQTSLRSASPARVADPAEPSDLLGLRAWTW